jgi:hypothetical protein
MFAGPWHRGEQHLLELSSQDAFLSNDGFAWLLNRSSSFDVARSRRALFRLQARSIRLYRDVSTASDARLELMTGRSAQAFNQPDIVGIGPRLVLRVYKTPWRAPSHPNALLP